MQRLTVCQILFVVLLIPALCRPSHAHKVRIFAWQDGGNIVTESKFSGGRPAQNVTVSVIETATGQTILSGITDTEGLYRFPIPQVNTKKLKIIVDGGDGHKNSWDYVLEGSSTDNKNTSSSLESKVTKKLPIQKKSNVDEKNTVNALSASELTKIIETTLDKKLAPIKRTLAENSERGPTLQDILGGIGYILGLAGIAAYMQSLNNKKGGGS